MNNKVRVVFTIEDADRDTGQVLYYSVIDPYFTVLGGQYLDALEAYYQELALRLDLLIMGKITAITVKLEFDLPSGLKVAPHVESDVQELAEFNFPKFGSSPFFQHNVPTFYHTIFGTQKKISWQHTPELASYTALLFNSANAPDWADEYGVITDNRGDVITAPPIVKKDWGQS